MDNITKTFISDEQSKFLSEQRGLLFEYYAQVSNPRLDNRILGDLQVWVYGNDRKDFTPHCHVMKTDKSLEWEVSIIDWSIINVKRGPVPGKLDDDFRIWLDSKSSRDKEKTNKEMLFIMWDAVNPNNDLLSFTESHSIEIKDTELCSYLKELKNEIEKSNG